MEALGDRGFGTALNFCNQANERTDGWVDERTDGRCVTRRLCVRLATSLVLLDSPCRCARDSHAPMRPKPWTAHGTPMDGAVRTSAEALPIARARITAENLAILNIGEELHGAMGKGVEQ